MDITQVLSDNLGKEVSIITDHGPFAAQGKVSAVYPTMVILEGSESNSHIVISHIVNVSISTKKVTHLGKVK